MNTADFSTVYDLYSKAIFAYCSWKSRDREVSQDLTQETFLRFWTCLQREEVILHHRAFLYRIAHNLFLDHVRRKRDVSLEHLVDAGFEPAIDAWHITYSRLDAEKPIQKMNALQESYKQALHQRYILNMTPAEIAATTGETPNIISVRIYRGLRNLKSQLKNPQPARSKNKPHAEACLCC